MNIKLKSGQTINYKGVEINELVGGIRNKSFTIFKGSMKRYFLGQSDLKCRLKYEIHFFKNYELMEDEANELQELRINVEISQNEIPTCGILFSDATHGNMESEKGMYDYALAINGYSDKYEIVV